MSLKLSNIKPFNYNGDITLWEYSDTIAWSFDAERNGHTTQFDDLTGYEIKSNNFKIQGDKVISSEIFDEWKKQIVDAINTNNEKIYNSDLSGYDIKFKMIAVDDDYAYTYEKYMNNKLIKTGKGWLKDLSTQTEKDAWRDAVREYKKNNNIKTESDNRKEKKEKTKKKIKQQDEDLPTEKPLTPPTLANSLAKAKEEPCEFVSEIVQKGIQGVTGMSAKEIINHYTELAKYNANVIKTNIVNSTSTMIEECYLPVEKTLDSMEDYFAQLDTDREEYLKTHSDDVCLFKLVVAEQVSNDTNASTTTPINTPPLPSNYEKVAGSPHMAKKTDEEFYANRTKGTLEWNTKQPNENVITNVLELWNIIYKDLGNKPYGEEADASMCRFKVNIRDKDGVIVQRRVTTHKAAAGTIKKIFEELLNIPTFRHYPSSIGSYNYRCVLDKREGKPTSLSKHAFGVAIDLNYEGDDNPNRKKDLKIENLTEKDNTDIKMRTFNHPVVKTFRKFAFGWGGGYSDFMHFSAHTYYKKIKNHGDKCFTGR